MTSREIWKDILGSDVVLWKYMKVSRFIELIESEAIYFPAASQFEDRFEGAVAVMPPDFPVDPRYSEIDDGERAFRELTRLTKVSCWHQAPYESAAMWKLYADADKGIAIRTTKRSLISGVLDYRIQPEYGIEAPWIGQVRYIDLLSERLSTGMEQRFFIKHIAFSWECEFRMIISLRMAEEFAAVVPKMGVRVPINPEVLIEKVILGPFVAAEEVERIRYACGKKGLANRIKKSGLLGQPRYI